MSAFHYKIIEFKIKTIRILFFTTNQLLFSQLINLFVFFCFFIYNKICTHITTADTVVCHHVLDFC